MTENESNSLQKLGESMQDGNWSNDALFRTSLNYMNL